MNFFHSKFFLFSLFLGCFIYLSSGITTFPVYRLIQYTQGDTFYGSQRTNVNLLATSQLNLEDLTRKIVVSKWEEFNEKSFESILEKNAEGILVILPNNVENLKSEELTNWRTFEEKLLKVQLSIPFYFTFEDESVNIILESIKSLSLSDSAASSFSNWLTADNYQLVVSQQEATPVKEISVANYQAFLSGSSLNSEGDSPVTIAVVAHYDTFGAVPSLSFGANANGGSVVGIIELLRLFSKLYSGFRTQANYNIVFLLTGAGKLNFGGSRYFLTKSDTKLVDSIEFVLALDSISKREVENQNKMYLHVNKLSKDERIQSLYNHFTATAKGLGIDLEIVPKKSTQQELTPPSSTSSPVQWEHEVFYRRKIPSATLSSRSNSPHGLFQYSDIFDTSSSVDFEWLEKNIRLVGESLSKHIYNLHQNNVSVFEDSNDLNSQHIRSWVEAVTSVPRMAPFLPLDSPLLYGFERTFDHYTQGPLRAQGVFSEEEIENESNNNGDPLSGSGSGSGKRERFLVQNFKLDFEYQFYTGNSLSMSVYKVKPFLFEVLLSLCITAYLCLLYSWVKGPKDAWDQFKEIWSPSDKRRKAH